MPLIYTLTGRNTFPRVYVEGDPRARPLRGRPPRATMLRVHGNRLWAAGDPDHPSRLYFSEVLNAEQWEPVDFEDQSQNFLVSADAGSLEIEPADGQRIRAIGPTFRGLLPVYKDHSIFSISGNSISDFIVRELTSAAGAVSHFGVTNFGDDQAFVSRAGVHSLSASDNFGDLEQALLSRDLRDYWNEEVNVEALQQACFASDNEPLDRLEVLVPTYASGADGFTPNRVLCLHYGVRPQTHPAGLWSIKKITGRSMTTTRLQGASRERVLVGSTDGYLNLQDQASAIDFPRYGVRTITESTASVGDFQLSATGTDSIEVNLNAQTVDTAANPILLGKVGGARHAGGFILVSANSATIPVGAHITQALLLMNITSAADARYCNLRIFGEMTNAPATYSTYADFIGRTLTKASVDVSDLERTSGTISLAADVGPIIQEIIESGNWDGDTADKIALQIFDNGSFNSPFTSSTADPQTRVNATAQFELEVEYWTL